MNRREFFRRTGAGLAVGVVAPQALAVETPKVEIPCHEWADLVSYDSGICRIVSLTGRHYRSVSGWSLNKRSFMSECEVCGDFYCAGTESTEFVQNDCQIPSLEAVRGEGRPLSEYPCFVLPFTVLEGESPEIYVSVDGGDRIHLRVHPTDDPRNWLAYLP